MKKLIALFVLMMLVSQLLGQQTSISFRVDISDLIESGYFSNNSGDKVLVRGSFNDWKGSAYELKQSSDSSIYIGEFSFGTIGDTISYKYVIEKGKNQFYWENKPNPLNGHRGNRQAIISQEKLILPTAQFSSDEYIHYPVCFSKLKLQEDYLQFRNILESTHPALYDYTSKESLDSIFDCNYQKVDSELEFTTFLMLMTEVISKVGCGHSSLWVPNKYWIVAPKRLFPLRMQVCGNKAFVTGSYHSRQEIPLGSEILALNGQPIHLLLKKLASLTSADGFNPSYRSTKAAKNFAIKYSLAFGFPNSFVLDYKVPGSDEVLQKSVHPISKQAIDKGKVKQTELSFQQIDENRTGILTINTFGYYGQVKLFHTFIDSVFTEIKQKETENLILDLRGNSGGDPFCSAYLWKYLEPEPLAYFQDHYGRYDTLANPIPMPVNNFRGKLFTLIDGNGFSTTGHFCGLLKYHQVGKFIGSELGSTYTCTGNATYPPLNHTGIMVGTARVRRYTSAVKNMNAKRGVMPDYYIESTQKDILENKDTVMDFALSLVREK